MRISRHFAGGCGAGEIMITEDRPADLMRRDRRAEAADRLLVTRFRSLVARGGIIKQNGRSILYLAGSTRKAAA